MSESCMMVERESGIQVLNWVIFNPVSLRSLFHPPLSHPAAAQLRVKKLCNSVVISLSPFVQRLLDSLGFYNAWYTRKMDETETFSFHSRRFFIFIYSRHSASSSSLSQWKMHLKFSRSSLLFLFQRWRFFLHTIIKFPRTDSFISHSTSAAAATAFPSLSDTLAHHGGIKPFSRCAKKCNWKLSSFLFLRTLKLCSLSPARDLLWSSAGCHRTIAMSD